MHPFDIAQHQINHHGVCHVNHLRTAILVLCLLAVSFSTACAQQTTAQKTDSKLLEKLIAKATAATMDNWKGDHWNHSENRKSSKDGDAMSYVNAVYWNFLAGECLGDHEAAKRSMAHYKYMVEHWWNPEKNRFNTGYDFLFNAHIVISFALSLRDAPGMIPADVQADMKLKLQGMCAFLPTYTTSLKNTNDDLRANNQDAFAAYALALAGQVLNDPKITNDAMVKFRSVIACIDGPFWREGGIDVGYQIVGEPGMMGAADLLWDQLSFEERKKISDISLLGRMTNGFNFETARSPSRFFDDARSVSSGLINHTANPLIAHDVYDRVSKLLGMNFSNWELYDLSPLCFHGALVNNFDALLKTKRESADISWGGLGSQFMRIDESKSPNTGMTRVMLSDPTGMLFIGGDYSKVNPRQAIKKFGATEPFDEFDQGGMRYLAGHEHLYVWTDANDGLPAITSKQDKLKREQLAAKAYVGFAASQYQLTQQLTDEQGNARTVTQLFVPVQGMQLIVTFAQPEQTLDGLSYALPMQVDRPQISGQSIHMKQTRLNNTRQVDMTVASLVGASPVIADAKVQPYHRANIQIGSQRFPSPTELDMVTLPLGDLSISVIALVPDCSAADWQNMQVRTRLDERQLHIHALMANHEQVDVWIAREQISELAGVQQPTIGLAQIFIRQQGKLTGFSTQGKGLKLDDQVYYHAKSPVGVSGLKMTVGSVLEVDGQATVNNFWADQARSLIDQQEVKLPLDQTQTTGRWWLD
jgi:hypothetical protein